MSHTQPLPSLFAPMLFHDVDGRVRGHNELSTAAFEPRTLGARLSNIRRYCGLPTALTVAEHCVLTAYLARENNESKIIQAMCLTHDLTDPFLGDMNGVHKPQQVRDLEHHMSSILAERGWIMCSNDVQHRIVKRYDIMAQAEERRVIWPLVYGEERYSVRPRSSWESWVKYLGAYQP